MLDPLQPQHVQRMAADMRKAAADWNISDGATAKGILIQLCSAVEHLAAYVAQMDSKLKHEK